MIGRVIMADAAWKAHGTSMAGQRQVALMAVVISVTARTNSTGAAVYVVKAPPAGQPEVVTAASMVVNRATGAGPVSGVNGTPE